MTGAAWLSSARVVRCSVKSGNERNPLSLVASSSAGNSKETAGVKPEEGGDDVKSSWPLTTGATHVLQWQLQREARPRGGANPKKVCLSSDWSLQLDSMKLESLVIAVSA